MKVSDTKRVDIIYPAAATNNDSPVGAYADANPVSVATAGFSRADFYVTIGATDVALSSLGVYSGPAAASGASDSTYSAVSGKQASGSSGSGRLPQATDDNNTFHITVDLRGDVGDYLALDCVVGSGTTGAYVTAYCVLSEANESPISATERGVAWSI